MLENMSNLFQVFCNTIFIPSSLPRDYPRSYNHDGRHKCCLLFPGTVGYIALAYLQNAPMYQGQSTHSEGPRLGHTFAR